jgi:hypothetical protein
VVSLPFHIHCCYKGRASALTEACVNNSLTPRPGLSCKLSDDSDTLHYSQKTKPQNWVLRSSHLKKWLRLFFKCLLQITNLLEDESSWVELLSGKLPSHFKQLHALEQDADTLLIDCWSKKETKKKGGGRAKNKLLPRNTGSEVKRRAVCWNHSHLLLPAWLLGILLRFEIWNRFASRPLSPSSCDLFAHSWIVQAGMEVPFFIFLWNSPRFSSESREEISIRFCRFS